MGSEFSKLCEAFTRETAALAEPLTSDAELAAISDQVELLQSLITMARDIVAKAPN